jgi:hypothetical protein
LRIEVAGDDVGVSMILRGKVSRHVLLALSRFGSQLRRVKVSLGELANPLGGVDQQCRMVASLQEGEDVHSEAIDGGFDTASVRAAGLLAKGVELALESDLRRGTRAPEGVKPLRPGPRSRRE